MSDIPMYSGATANLGGGAKPLETPTFGLEANHKAIQRGATAVDGAVQQFMKIQDSAPINLNESNIREGSANLDVELEQRLALAPGAKGALFDEKGDLLKNDLDELVRKHTQKIDDYRPTYLMPESRMQADSLKADAIQNMQLRAMGHVARGITANSRRAHEGNLKLALESDDYEGAMNIMDRAEKMGLKTKDEVETGKLQIGKDQHIKLCDSLLVKNPTGLFDKLEDGSLDKYLSPLEQEGYRRKLRSMKDEEGRDGFIKSFTLVPKSVSEDGSSKKKDDTPEFTGRFTEEECGWINAIRNGRKEDIKEQVATRAIVEARAFKPGDPNSPHMEIARDKFVRKYELFGMEKEFLTRQWGIAEAANKKLVNPTVDVGNIVEDIGKQGLLVDDEAMAKFRSSIRGDDDKEWKKGGVMREKYMTTADIKNTDDGRAAKEKYIVSETKRMSSDIQARVGKSFLAWRDSTEEGQKASSVEQYEKIHSLVREETKKKDLILVNKGGEIDESVNGAKQAQNNKFEEFAKARGKEIFIDTRDKSEQLQEVSLGYDTSKKDLPEGILLPKAAMEGFDKENGVVEVTFDNKRFRRFSVVGECEGDTPIMTYEVARKGAYNPKSSYKVNMRIRGGNTKAAMEEQDEASKGMNIIKEGNINSPQAPQFKSAEMIIGNEARRDKKGNLSVYKLPAGDGGGTHEIAGINNGSHPKEFAKLKGMLDSGDHQGAEQEAQRYIMKYTQPVGNALDSAGVKSAGISYFLRDMHFNGGEYGVARVICRAMGIPDSKKLNDNTSEAMKNYLKTHTEDELLDALKGSRENLYKSIASNNSEKQQFLRGWINRNNKAYKQAKGMA